MDTVPVEVRELRKAFRDESRGTVAAVDGASFTCARGEVFGLLGANGAGKTTTLRMLATILQPTGGAASVMGHNVVEEPQRVRESIGFYTASTALYPRLTARETLAFFARINGVAERSVKERTEELVSVFGLTEYADVLVDKLSQGMKQKVSIARTVAHDPPVLIFDEPTVGLDVLNAIEMQKVIARFRDAGKTVVFSTHIMSEAEKLCDRIAVIHRGRILACDTLEELRSSIGHHYLEDIFVSLVERCDGGD